MHAAHRRADRGPRNRRQDWQDAIFHEGPEDFFGSDDELVLTDPESPEHEIRRSERDLGKGNYYQQERPRVAELRRLMGEGRRNLHGNIYGRGAAHRDTLGRTPSPPQLPPWYEGQGQPGLGRQGLGRAGEGRYPPNVDREGLHHDRDRMRFPPRGHFLYDEETDTMDFLGEDAEFGSEDMGLEDMGLEDMESENRREDTVRVVVVVWLVDTVATAIATAAPVAVGTIGVVLEGTVGFDTHERSYLAVMVKGSLEGSTDRWLSGGKA